MGNRPSFEMSYRAWGRWRRLVGAVLAAALILASTPVHAAPAAQLDTGQYTVADCSNVDKNQLRDEIEAHGLAVIEGSRTPMDIDALVSRKWSELGMDAAVDVAVQSAVDDLASQEDYLNRFISGWWGEKAQEYAEQIANQAFASPTFKAKLDELSYAIGQDVARQVETQFAQAASVALLCLQAYVGEQYAGTLFAAFQRSIQLETQQLDLAIENTPTFDAVGQHELALAGVGTILVTQLVYRLGQKLGEKIAQRVASKVVGRILGRAGSSLIPIAGWVIGLGLIAYDLWEGAQGAFPQIQESLQSEEVKVKIREEIATAIRDDLPDQAALIALETSVSLVEQWQGFCHQYEYVCMVADQNPAFRDLLGLVALDELDRLASLVGWFMNTAGRVELDRAIASGALEKLVALPQETINTLAATERPDEVLAWQALAGDRLAAVAAHGIHRVSTPAKLDEYALAALLTVADTAAIQKLLKLAPAQRDALLALPADTLKTLATARSATELATLANRLLTPDQQGRPAAVVADEVARGVTTVAELAAPTPTPTDAAVAAAQPLEPGSAGSIATAPAPNAERQTAIGFGISLALLLLGVLAGVAALGSVRRRRLEDEP